MNFFGNTLIEAGLVTADQIVDALVKQSEELTSPIRICLDQNLVKPQQLLDAVLVAAEEHITLPEAMVKSKLLDPDSVEQLTLALKKQRRPVGQILVEEGGINLQKIAPLLVEFQKTQERLPDADSFEFHFPEVHGETRKQYLRFFSSELKEQIEKLIHALPPLNQHQLQDEDSASKRLEDLVQQLSAAAGFARMEVSRHLVERATLLIEHMNSGRVNWNHDSSQRITRDLLSTLDVMWELQRFIEISGSEQQFWQNQQSRQNYLKIFQSLERHLS